MMNVTDESCKAARARLRSQGLSIRAWAEEHGVNESTAYAVLNGQKKCLRGKAREVAILLGLNDTTDTQDAKPE